jgi:hypothetical protein
VQAAIISAGVTVITAGVSVAAVVWQIGRQARQALEQNLHNERLKIKLSVYDRVLTVCRRAAEAQIKLGNYVLLFPVSIQGYQRLRAEGINPTIPNERVPVLIAQKRDFDAATIDLIKLTEDWEIIDPRVQVFRTALHAARQDVDDAYDRYFDLVIHMMPAAVPGSSEQGATLFPWQPPEAPGLSELMLRTNQLHGFLQEVGSYIFDFQIEMQNLLVSEIFDRVLAPRQPLDPRHRVITLNAHQELSNYFNSEATSWGRMRARADVWVQQDVAKRKQGNGPP